jgi:hypothetical protein
MIKNVHVLLFYGKFWLKIEKKRKLSKLTKYEILWSKIRKWHNLHKTSKSPWKPGPFGLRLLLS